MSQLALICVPEKIRHSFRQTEGLQRSIHIQLARIPAAGVGPACSPGEGAEPVAPTGMEAGVEAEEGVAAQSWAGTPMEGAWADPPP